MSGAALNVATKTTIGKSKAKNNQCSHSNEQKKIYLHKDIIEWYNRFQSVKTQGIEYVISPVTI